MEIAVIAAENVDGELFAKAMKGDEAALLAVKDSLSFFLAGDSVTYVYTLMPKDADWFQFVVDTDPDDPGEYAEDYEAQDAMFEAHAVHMILRNTMTTTRLTHIQSAKRTQSIRHKAVLSLCMQ